MARSLFAALLTVVVLLSGSCGPLAVWPSRAPRLVVVIVLDQFRYDYLTRFRSDYRYGLDRLLRGGAVFRNARFAQAPTVTAVGHSIVMTGAMPSVSGIVGNAWFERETSRQVTSVCDGKAKLVGGETPVPGPRCEDADAASPRRLLVSTIGDELRNRTEASKVVGVSLKARSAILPAGHRATGAFWFDDRTGSFITSDFYTDKVPAWVEAFNGRRLAQQFVSRKWPGFDAWDFKVDAGVGRPFERLLASPWGNELVERMAEAAIEGEQLGQRGVTDVLTVSFSSNDYVGHQAGPDSPEVRDMCVRSDDLVGRLIDVVSSVVGRDDALVVLTADHGVAPVPSVQAARRMPGGYIYVDIEDLARAALERRYGPGAYVLGSVDNALYFNRRTLAEKNIDLDAACRIVSEALFAVPQTRVVRTYTGAQLASGAAPDQVARAMANGYFPSRSGDLVLVFEPYQIPFSRGPYATTHFSPYNYDTHVPLIFYGKGVAAGTFDETVEINDVAPTLAVLIDVEMPSGSSGRVLPQVLARQ
jgi:predicted AlkP superfamily pyrophosphatase or phosphodiesterase